MRLISFMLVAVAACSAPALAQQLSPLGDKGVVRLLNDAEVMAKLDHGPPYSVRLLRVKGHGECRKGAGACPNQTLYAAVSTFDEDPEQAVWVLPSDEKWEFVRWKNVPKKDGPSQFVIAELQRTSGDDARQTTVELRINPWAGSLVENRKPPEN